MSYLLAISALTLKAKKAALKYDQTMVFYARNRSYYRGIRSPVCQAVVDFIKDYTHCRKFFDFKNSSHSLTVTTLSYNDPAECQTRDKRALTREEMKSILAIRGRRHRQRCGGLQSTISRPTQP